MLDYADLFSVTLPDDNIQEFHTRWDEVLLSMSKIPSDDILESLYKLRISESAQLKAVFGRRIQKKISVPNYQKLKTMVKRSFDQKLLLRNFDVRHEKSTCHQWKEKGQCSQGDRCSFGHQSDDRAQKAEHTAATPSEPSFSRGRSVSKKEVSDAKSDHGAILRQPCRYLLKGTCTRSLCEYWHPHQCHFCKMKRVVRLQTSVCFRITRLMNNQILSRKKSYFPKEEKAMTRTLWLL